MPFVGPHTGLFPAQCPRNGNFTLRITGRDFTPGICIGVALGLFPCRVTAILSATLVEAAACAGAGAALPLTLQVGDYVVASPMRLSYALLPVVDNVTGCIQSDGNCGVVGCSNTGDSTLTVRGDNFRASGARVFLRRDSVTVECTSVAHSPVIPDQLLTFTGCAAGISAKNA